MLTLELVFLCCYMKLGERPPEKLIFLKFKFLPLHFDHGTREIQNTDRDMWLPGIFQAIGVCCYGLGCWATGPKQQPLPRQHTSTLKPVWATFTHTTSICYIYRHLVHAQHWTKHCVGNKKGEGTVFDHVVDIFTYCLQ